MRPSNYYDLAGVDAAIAAGQHREVIGGRWDEIGRHQMDFLLSRGLTPSDRLLDVGCGSLRLGVHAVPYLDAGHYFGTDISAGLIEAGLERELDDALRTKAPRENFAVNEDFDFGFLTQPVDVAVAQSVFTHLPINHLRRCLARLAPAVRSGGIFYATIFECPPDADLQAPQVQSPGGIVTFDYRDPYHYRPLDLGWAIDRSPWRLEFIGDWGHPRAQRMAAFHRR